MCTYNILYLYYLGLGYKLGVFHRVNIEIYYTHVLDIRRSALRRRRIGLLAPAKVFYIYFHYFVWCIRVLYACDLVLAHLYEDAMRTLWPLTFIIFLYYIL